MRKEDYNFIYHYNTESVTPSRRVGAMTVESMGSYFNGGDGDYVFAKNRVDARELLKKKLNGTD